MSDSETQGNHKRKGCVAQTRMQNAENLKTGTDKNVSKAPTGLLTEFLSSVMTKDYQTAFQYCAKILSYEPDNTTARDFYPLILEKLELISHEDYEDSTSDSYSNDSKSSGSSISQVCSQSSDDDKRFWSGDENYSNLGRKNAVNDLKASGVCTDEDKTGNKKVETKKSRSSYSPTRENSAGAPPLKAHSKSKVRVKAADSSTRMSPRLLIHPTKTKILKASNESNGGKKQQIKPKKLKQKDQEKPAISEKPSSSKILLYPTRTITFPKVITSQTKSEKD